MNRLLKYTLAAAVAPTVLMAIPASSQLPPGIECANGTCVDKRFTLDPCVPGRDIDQTENGEVRFMRARPDDRSVSISADGLTSRYKTGTTLFPEVNPFDAGLDLDPTDPHEFPEVPSNLLPTIYENALDCGGDEIPNTLPSTPEDPYNLMSDPVVTDINPTSREDDLRLIIKRLEEAADPDLRARTDAFFFPEGKNIPADPRRGVTEVIGDSAGDIDQPAAETLLELQPEVQLAIDILEGNPVPNRIYSGFPVLNYNGPEKVKAVECNADKTECSVDVHQIWGRQSILSDTMFIDPTEALNVTWKVNYTVDITSRGEEDFAPFVVYFDDPQDVGAPGRNGVAMDATFFPMKIGKRYEFSLDMAPGRFWNLTYHWGWRVHSPRIQAIENARKMPGGKNIVVWENEVFCSELDEDGNCTVFPNDSREAQLNAISMIGELAPAKRMWRAFRKLQNFDGGGNSAANNPNIQALVAEARAAFDDWTDRTRLPRGFEQDPDAELTMVYVNNTMYGTFKDNVREAAQERWTEWETRGQTLTVKLLNGDYFPHQYMNVDFGGNRGWENVYHNTLPIGGQGPWFTFGRAYWFQNLFCPAPVASAQPLTEGDLQGNPFRRLGPLPSEGDETDNPMATPGNQFCPPPAGQVEAAWTEDGIGFHNVEIEYRYEPSRRLRFYQFDPTHHNVQIWSVH